MAGLNILIFTLINILLFEPTPAEEPNDDFIDCMQGCNDVFVRDFNKIPGAESYYGNLEQKLHFEEFFEPHLFKKFCRGKEEMSACTEKCFALNGEEFEEPIPIDSFCAETILNNDTILECLDSVNRKAVAECRMCDALKDELLNPDASLQQHIEDTCEHVSCFNDCATTVRHSSPSCKSIYHTVMGEQFLHFYKLISQRFVKEGLVLSGVCNKVAESVTSFLMK